MSIPLKLRGCVHNHAHAFLAKLVTKEGVRAHREVVTKKNTRFKKHGVYDISHKEFDAAYDLLNSEARFLKASRAAGISVPSLYGVYQLPTCAALVLEFVQGTPFEQSHFRAEEVAKTFFTVKQLRESRLVHGDLRRDNFF